MANALLRPGSMATDFAECLIDASSNADDKWWDRVAPHTQREIETIKASIKKSIGDGNTELQRIVDKLDEAWLGLSMDAYYTGIRHGVAAEKFRTEFMSIELTPLLTDGAEQLRSLLPG